MKYLLMSLFIIYSQSGATMNLKKIEDRWFVSRLTIKEDFFRFVRTLWTGKSEKALAIEPFYYLQSFAAEKYVKSSPVKAIKKVNTSFRIFTLSGSVYEVQAKDMLNIDSINSLCRFLGIKQINVYRRRDLCEIQKDIDNGQIFGGHNYKSWLRYNWERGDEEIFHLGTRLKRMKNNQEMMFELTQDDLDTLKPFKLAYCCCFDLIFFATR